MNRIVLAGGLAAFLLIFILIADAEIRKQKAPGRRSTLWVGGTIVIGVAAAAMLLIKDANGALELQLNRAARHDIGVDSLSFSVGQFVAKDPGHRKVWVVRKLINASIPGSEPIIVDVFRGYPGHDKEIAEDLLNSGNPVLANAALAWAKEWGLQIEKHTGDPRARWH